MEILSLFDGISIAQQALKNLGVTPRRYFSSEVDKYAIQITQKNFPDTIQIGDVRDIAKNFNPFWKGIDLLIGGSPCQDLSVAKKDRRGLDGERSGLFWEYVRILKTVKPKYFVLENVNSMPKEAKDLITRTLGVEPIMINAALVSAQNRKRLFWTNIPNVTLPEDRGILLRDILEEDNENVRACSLRGRYILNGKRKDIKGAKTTQRLEVGGLKANTVTSVTKDSLVFLGGIGKKDWAGDDKQLSRNYPQGNRVYSPNGKTPTLSANGGGLGAKTGLYEIPLKSKTVRTAKKGGGIQDRHNWENINDIRKLTPIECERLQSLPDNYTAGVSNTQRYKACGNGFNCAVIEHILKNII